MSAQTTIKHTGFVDEVTGDTAIVKINSQSACAACHAKGACSAADQEEKILSVNISNMHIKAGEMVHVIISKRTGLHAVAMGYVYPFLLLFLVLIAGTIAGLSELYAGLAALGSLIPYYISIYLLKERISKAFTFKLEKITNDA